MTEHAKLACRCGEVQGRLQNATPRRVNRGVCYCDDCQAFLHHLGRADLLDEHGGTDFVQVAPASLAFERGTERIVGLRLGPKGLYRWYADCCKTPLGNTLGLALPFVGIGVQAFAADARGPDEIFGPVLGSILGKFAVGDPPERANKLPLRLMGRAIRLVIGWRFTATWPHPFFDRATRAPIYPITILSRAERDAVRPLCGPEATSVARA